MTMKNGDLLRSIVESSDDAIISKTLDGTITSWNPAAERMYGYSAAEAIGQNVGMLVPPDHVDEESEILLRLRRGERIEHFQTERRTKDGRIVRVILSISPIREADGTIVGGSSIGREANMGERQLAEMRSLFDVAVREAAVGNVLSKRVHDLKGQMAAIAGNLELLTDRLGEFVTQDDINEGQEERQKTIERKIGRRTTAIVVALAALLAGVYWHGHQTVTATTTKIQSETRARAIDGCERRDQTNQAIRDIVDRSIDQQQQLDVSKLSADTRRVLAELQAAQASAGSGPDQERTLVYAKTPLQDCSKLPRP